MYAPLSTCHVVICTYWTRGLQTVRLIITHNVPANIDLSLGTWVLDLNKETGGQHQFVGTDVLATQLPKNYPPNTTFHPQNINNRWPEEYLQSFDLVHQRLTLPFAGNRCQESLFALMDMVKPGGWIQLMEGTLLTPEPVERNPCMHNYLKIVRAIYISLGAPLTLSVDIPKWLEEGGFVNVETREVHVQMGASNENVDLGRKGAVTQRLAAMGMVEAARSKLFLYYCVFLF